MSKDPRKNVAPLPPRLPAPQKQPDEAARPELALNLDFYRIFFGATGLVFKATDMTEEKAIKLCLKHRDPRGFEFLVRQFRREAYYHAFALLGNEADAADACQESFARAFAAMPRLEKLDQFYPWFYRILRNRCLNLLDRQRTRDRYATEQLAHRKQAPQKNDDPRDALEAREERARVWHHLSRLKPQHREILTLKYIHDFCYNDIAATLDIPRGTVMSRLYEARAAFRSSYERTQDS